LQFQRALERYLESRPRQVGQRDLATLINYHFKNEKQQMRQRIEAQLSGSLSSASSREVPVLQSSTNVTPVTLTETPPGPAHPPVVADSRRFALPALRMGPKSLIAAGGTLAAVGVVAVALYLNRASPPAAGRAAAPAPVAVPVVAAPAPPPVEPPPAAGRRSPPSPSVPAPRPQTVQLTILVEPRDATVTLDGKTLTGNPFQGEFPLERRTHVVQVSAPGYASSERMITLAEDTRLDISLVANRAHRSSGSSRREPARAASATAEPRRIEPGMELRRPPSAAPRRQIDEKDPYAP
jgi:hypothetical protein